VFLKILKAEGFIYSFKNLNNTITIVLNHTNDIIPLLKIKTFSKISKPYFIKNKILVSKIKKFKNEIFIIQTDKGIISNKQILNLGIGGILIAVLS
jgi:ribosomal protein S8